MLEHEGPFSRRSSLRARLEGLFWQESRRWRAPARRLRQALSLLRYRWRASRTSLPPRLVAVERRGAIKRPRAQELLLRGELPEVTAEALRMTAAAEDLEIVIAGAGELGPEESQSIRPLAGGDARLLRGPSGGAAPELVGRLVPFFGEKVGGEKAGGEGDGERDGDDLTPPPLRRSGQLLLRPDVGDGRVIRRPVYEVEKALASLEEMGGPPATLFLLPYLAVGGAERLLFSLLEELAEDESRRWLVVTLDPHRRRLGQTVDRCRRLTPWVFTLGDWMPRECAWSALCHLVRRFRVRELFSWNGTVDFYDRVHELRADFPDLRILHQLYHHRGAWTSRTTPRVIGAVDRHVAVNRAIARALEERGVPRQRIDLIHHGVALPSLPTPAAKKERRRELGLPEDALDDAVVAGTFIRLHAQKRPLDILEVARRFRGEKVFFLLVGGGPLEKAVDEELAKRPLPNLIRRPMTREPLPLYDALDLCLMTSSYEGLPVFLLDGLARGLPGVAPAVGDIPLLFEGSGEDGGGLTVPRPGDIDGLERAIRRLLDPEERPRRGARARETVEKRFGLERYRAAYRRALGGDS